MRAKDLKFPLELNIFYLHGDDQYWRDAQETFFMSLIPLENRDFNLTVFSALPDLATLDMAVNSQTMFGGICVILVKDTNFKVLDVHKKYFLKILESVPKQTYIVFYSEDGFTPSVKAKMQEIDCSKADASDLKKIVESFFKNGIENEAINLIIQYTNCDMGRLNLELAKLTAYSDGEKITADIVKDLVYCDIENKTYEISNAISSKNTASALDIIDRMISKGSSYNNILSALSSHYRKMFFISISDATDLELSKILGIKEYAVKMNRKSATKYTSKELKHIFQELILAEFNFKSGVYSEKTATENIISKLLI